MSSGDPRASGKPELVKGRAVPGPVNINRNYDIAYLAGYSTDGKMVYIDRHIPSSLRIGDRQVNVIPFLVAHESAEKWAIDNEQKPYATAHKDYGNVAERAKLKLAKVNDDEYERALRPYIKATEHERIVRSPRNLDLVPYRAKPRDESLLRAIIAAGTAPKVSKAIARYSRGSPATRCGNCEHYGQHNCEVVVGRIDPGYWCKYWENAR
jgi:hypothetical protein